MKKITVPFVIILSILTTNLFAQNKPHVFIKNISIVNVDKGTISKNMFVYIVDGLIKQIEKDAKKINSGTTDEIIDGTNKYLMPGYGDAHVHMPTESSPYSYKTYFLANLFNGVTSLRVMRYNPKNIAYKDSISKGTLIGPNLYLAQTITEFSGYDNMAKSFDTFKANGYMFVKYLWGLSKTQLDSVAFILKEKKIPLVGHVYKGDIAQALNLHYRSIEHAQPFIDLYKKDSTQLIALIPLFAKNNTYFTPGMHWYYYGWDQIDNQTLYNLPELAYAPVFLKDYWIKARTKYDSSFIQAKHEQYLKEKEAFRKDLVQFDVILRHMEKEKVKFLVGSDEQKFSVPGFTFHREIAHFANAHISNEDILKAATLNLAECLLLESTTGSISKGKQADLVVLNSDPLKNTANLQDINAVIKSGVYYKIGTLKELLDKSIANDNTK
jgi:hypothetical protein